MSLDSRVRTFRVADLRDRAALREALDGVENVLHLAGRVHVMREVANDARDAYHEANVVGTETLLEEASTAGVRKFVFFSSVKVLGERTTTLPFTEETEPDPADPYGESKLGAEEIVRTAARGSPTHHVILRLPLVYGPCMKGNLLRLFRLVDRGRPIPLCGSNNARSIAYVGNVVATTFAVLETPAAIDQTFMVSDGVVVSTRELVVRIGRALGRTVRIVPVPATVFRMLGGLGDLASRVLNAPFTSADAERLLGSLVVDSSKLQRVAGFTPPFGLEQALAETAAWYRSAGP